VEVQVRLKAYAALADDRLDQLLPPVTQVPSELHSAMRYSCLAPGKRLRPALALGCCEAAGASWRAALDVACAVEMIHCFSLIHDDLPALDNDDLRRGQPTCHVKFGEAMAVLAGDAMLALAFEIASENLPEAVCELSKATGRLARGEASDILAEGKAADKETIEFIHANKTGALMSAACAVGAFAGGASAEGYREYGEHLGMAFQIADDVLNETATAAVLGKAAGSDRDRAKATYPALYGVEVSRRMARDHAELAISCLPTPDEFLIGLAHYSVHRAN